MIGVPEPKTTQVTEIDPKGKTLHLDKWHMLPTYRLKLTVWYQNRVHGEPGKLKRKEVDFMTDYTEPNTANAAALEMAKDFRGENEWVMLVSRQEGEDNRLNQYAVGVWDWEKLLGTRYPCMWKLKLDWEKERLQSHKDGDLTAYVEVVRAWDSPLIPYRRSLKVENLKSAIEHGNPPPGHPVQDPYRFGKYVMQVRNNRAWQRLITTTPLWPIRNEKGEISLLREPRRIGEPNTHDHLHADAWRPRNISSVIAGLRANIDKLRLVERQPRDLTARFIPEGTEYEDQSLIERPAAIDWHLTKKWVIAKDIATLEKRIQLLKSPESPDTKSDSNRSARATLQTYRARPLVSLFCALAVILRCLQQRVLRREYRKSDKKVAVVPQGIQHKSMPKESCQDPNVCMCTAHRWRRATFPDHDPLPIIEKSTKYTDPEMYAQTPRWARDRTHKPRHVQHFIPEKKKYPKPRTFREYVRRELEINRPIPREAYVRIGVMTKQDCVNRWGVDWEADSKEIEEDFDKKHNVMKRKPEPATPQSGSADAYPWSELNGYPGCLREHEMPPSHDWERSVDEVAMTVAMTVGVCHIYTEMACLSVADLLVLMAIVLT